MAFLKKTTTKKTAHCFRWENDSNCVFTVCGWSADGEIIFFKFSVPIFAIYHVMKTNWMLKEKTNILPQTFVKVLKKPAPFQVYFGVIGMYVTSINLQKKREALYCIYLLRVNCCG